MPTCLIVDDTEDHRMIAEAFVEDMDAGLSVVLASTGEEAVEVCRRSPPGIILMDWSMPGDPGPVVIKKIKDLNAAITPYIIMCTGRRDSDDVKEAVKCGVDDYLVKPFTKESFQDKIKNALKFVR